MHQTRRSTKAQSGRSLGAMAGGLDQFSLLGTLGKYLAVPIPTPTLDYNRTWTQL